MPFALLDLILNRETTWMRQRILFGAGWMVLFMGVATAILLPPGRGTCGLPPIGANEFCGGNDYRVKVAVLLGSLGTAVALIALSRWTWMAVSLSAMALLVAGLGIAALVPSELSCPAGLRLHYGLTRDARPVCAEVGNPGRRVPPAVNPRAPLRAGFALGGFTLAATVIVGRLRSG